MKQNILFQFFYQFYFSCADSYADKFETILKTFPKHFRVVSAVFGSRALALADPYCHIAWNSVGVFVGLSATLRSNISETKGARAKVTMGS